MGISMRIARAADGRVSPARHPPIPLPSHITLDAPQTEYAFAALPQRLCMPACVVMDLGPHEASTHRGPRHPRIRLPEHSCGIFPCVHLVEHKALGVDLEVGYDDVYWLAQDARTAVYILT